MDWAAPWAKKGNMGCAASPSSVIRPRLQCRRGVRSSSAQRPGTPPEVMRSVTRGSQPANSAWNSSIVAVALQDSSVKSPAGAKATMLTALPSAIG